ncbi:Tricalbin-2 [Diplodia seriata]|uniref:Tricalbin-2 n=1 Tax=Diplodia seriata TaxID=420778 RepID=A0ABR3CAW4_9PEZI
MASRQDAELKQQGAIEAAQDPNTNVSPEDAEQKMLDEGRKAGGAGAALAFNPDASPADKAAQARSIRPALTVLLGSIFRQGFTTTINPRPQRSHLMP